MKKFDKILKELKEKSLFDFLYSNGHTPETIKGEIIRAFTPFFSNPDKIDDYAISYMVSDWLQYEKLKALYPDAENLINKIVSHYNAAKLIDENATLSTINNLAPLQIDSGNKFWSFVKLELNKSELEFEEFVQTTMKDIGDLVEGLMKVLLYENLAIDRIVRGKAIDIEKIKKLELGVILEELSTQSPFKELFIVPPENLKISDWRNISAHQNHKFLPDKKILCEYGPKENRKSFEINREELFKRVKQIHYTLQILSLSHKFFGFDNILEIKKINPASYDNNARDEIGVLMFASAVYSQGFEIEEISYQKETDATMVVKDLTDADPLGRSIHASQFLYPLWLQSTSKMVTIEFKTKRNKTFMKASVTYDVCEVIKNEEKGVDHLIENIKFDFLNDGG